jgi:hypothetical protein
VTVSGKDRADAIAPIPPARKAAAEAAAAGGCAESLADHLEGDAVGLSATYWLDRDEDDGAPPRSVSVRFVGERVGTDDLRDRFERLENVEGLPAGSGQASITTRVVGINAGEWQVTAVPMAAATAAAGSPGLPGHAVDDPDAVGAAAARSGCAPGGVGGPPPLPGALFVGAVASYTLGRQLLFPLRREPRRTSAGRLGTLAVSALIAVAALLASALAA